MVAYRNRVYSGAAEAAVEVEGSRSSMDVQGRDAAMRVASVGTGGRQVSWF